MSVGLMALLDDIAALAKVAAASVDDVIGHAAKVGAKSAGVVIDDAAVTPRYVVGFAAERELPIIAKIAKGSLINKLVFLLPLALLLAVFANWAITPLLMIGGAYLAYEGAEKVFGLMFPHKAHGHEAALAAEPTTPKEMEDQKVASAIKTDFILSAEIMAIALAAIPPEDGIAMRAFVLALVGIAITVGVYGVVALIVKADDIGVAMARNGSQGLGGKLSRGVGIGLVKGMPRFLWLLSIIGTAAMIWVGGGILVHGMETYGLEGVGHFIDGLSEGAAQAMPVWPGVFGWLVEAACYGVVGLVVGFALIPVTSYVLAPLARGFGALRGAVTGMFKA